MTAQRQENKERRFKNAVFVVFGVFVLFAVPVAEVSAAVTERVVVNRHTGLAIDGFDPVAYFTEGHPEQGSQDIEYASRGAIWRFCNEGNRAAFKAHPEIYSPSFGGYDPADIARGNPVPGRAQFWAIHGERLYLFSREETRALFAAGPDTVIAQANEKWPDVLKSLSDY